MNKCRAEFFRQNHHKASYYTIPLFMVIQSDKGSLGLMKPAPMSMHQERHPGPRVDRTIGDRAPLKRLAALKQMMQGQMAMIRNLPHCGSGSEKAMIPLIGRIEVNNKRNYLTTSLP